MSVGRLTLARHHSVPIRLLIKGAPFEDPGALLGLLTDEPAVHWSWAELQLHLGCPPERLDDALAELERDGLAHRQDGYTWPTRAAVKSRELLA